MTISAAVICLEAYKKADTAIKKQPSITLFDIHFNPSSSIYLNVTMKWLIMNEKLGLNVKKTSQKRGNTRGSTRIRTGDEGFADLCLTAWRCCHNFIPYSMH